MVMPDAPLHPPRSQDASSSTSYIYADKYSAGASLNILTSVTLTKPLVTGRFLAINLGAGVTLTLKAQPRFPRGRVLAGSGSVRFSGAGPFWVLPEWWMGSSSNTDWSVGLAAARAACASSTCVIVVTSTASMKTQLTLSPALRVWGSSGSTMQPLSSSTTGMGLVLGPGTYTSALTLPMLTGFTGTALTVRGTAGASVYVPSIGGVAQGVVFQTDASATTVSSTSVEVFFFSSTKSAVVLASSTASAALSSVSFYSNFLLRAASGTASALAISGSAAPKLTGSSFIWSSIDVSNTASSFATVRSSLSGYVVGLTVKVTSWAGAFPAGASFVIGKFQNLSLMMKLANAISSKVLAFTGVGSTINWAASWNRANAYALTATRTPNPAASAMIKTNFAVVNFPPALITGSWAAGGAVVRVTPPLCWGAFRGCVWQGGWGNPHPSAGLVQWLVWV